MTIFLIFFGYSLRSLYHHVFRESIYDSTIADIKLSDKIELDETMFGGHRKGKRGWEPKVGHYSLEYTRETNMSNPSQNPTIHQK